MSLISNFEKLPQPDLPGYMDLNSDSPRAVVSGSASVPVNLKMNGTEIIGTAGVDIIFLIDNSGSMQNSDPNKDRFKAIKTLSTTFALDRDNLDRTNIILFSGDEATLNDRRWKKWSELPALVDTLGNPDGVTPMEKAMTCATELLAAQQDSYYRLVILLSDGEPEPDDESHPQTENIKNICIPEACANRVLYSTVYLSVPEMPLDNGLLLYIARQTDYITPYQVGAPPKYYFRIQNTNQMVVAFRELFNKIKDRRVPLDVHLVEKITPRLRLDPQYPPEFTGNGFDPTQNVIGTALEDALAQFANGNEVGNGIENKFEIRLNELKGDAVLNFHVKLNLDTVTSAEFRDGYVLLEINHPDSIVSWLEPTNGTGSQRTPDLALPQAEIKFELGLKVIKELQQDQSGNIVNIAVDNLDQKPVPWFELIECPSSYINSINIEDDFGFKPLAMLFKNRILPWFLSLIPANVPPLTRPQKAQLERVVRKAYAPFLSLASELDPLLCQISAFTDFDFTDPGRFWYTEAPRCIYKLIESLPGKSSHSLRFRIQDASYALDKQTGIFISKVDYTGKQRQRSMYKSEGKPAIEVSPNPNYSQIVYPINRPDLWLLTALKEAQWKHFAPLFKGGMIPGIGNSWNLLNSKDIEPFWQNHGSTVGVKVKVRNCGMVPATGAQLRVRTHFLPFTGNEFTPPYKVNPPLVGSTQMILPSIPTHRTRDFYPINVSFRSLNVLTATHPSPAQSALLQQVRLALAVTVVEIDPAEGEVMLSNNCAIEIVPIVCG